MQTTEIITAGAIAAQMHTTADAVTFSGPLTFNEDVVVEDGSWTYPVDTSDRSAIEDLLEATYMAEFKDWCARKDVERRVAREAAPRRASYRRGQVHTPCPTLWAGR